MPHSPNTLRRYINLGDRLVDRYVIEDKIGAGAFGAIYSAIDEQTSERVAVKALPPQVDAATNTALARFRREMKVISKLIHRNIIGLYDFGQDDQGVFFMILEYVDGMPLDRMVHGSPLTSSQTLSVCEQIASALSLAHHSGVIHRDLKPANIMVTEESDGLGVKVLDFGMAKLLSNLDDESVAELTREGMAVGTPRYIAPEQARGEDVGPWTDLYALGLLMYEMLTGARAVKADDVEGAVSAHVSDEPLELHEIDDVPQAFRSTLFGLIDKDPNRRYRLAEDFLADLEAIRHETGAGMASPQGPHFDPRKARVENPGQTDASAPDSATSPALSENRERAREIANQARQNDDLELDWDNYDKHAPKTSDPALNKRGKDGKGGVHVWFRSPDRAVEWAEASVAPLLGLFAFMLFTAQFRAFDYEVRLLVGLVPVITALGWSVAAGRGSWRYSFFRLWNLFSLAAVLVAHALGPVKLINGLYRHPTWFLAPVQDWIGMGTAQTVLTWGMRRYAVLLSTLLDSGAGVIN
jgi:serine/threonine protein kinase